MKKPAFFFALFLVLILAVPQIASANMAAPKQEDIGSSITFEENDALAVLSEVLDITVTGATAEIVATYQMQNTREESVSTSSMFLSPNIEYSGVKVLVNGEEVDFTVESYGLYYQTEIRTEDWRYVVLTDETMWSNSEGEQMLDAISFAMDFSPKETYDVVVSYTYHLGGYPEKDFNVKQGRITYYLAPAALWKDFGGLTINLYLDEDMPVMKESNLPFEKVGARTFQYVSDTLPEENLKIVIDENWWQNIFSTLKSPYLFMPLVIYAPIILPALLLALILFLLLRKKKRRGS